MPQHEQKLYVGSPRGTKLHKTQDVITRKLRRLGSFSGQRMLDVGCGDGSFTSILGRDFREVCGIDVQEEYLRQFQDSVADDTRFQVANMSASAMTFPDAHFDTIVSIETLEHIPDLAAAVKEMHRVLRPGGELIITVPNRWFPFENHGMRIGSWERHGRIPLLTYVPFLHRRWSLARVFTASDLDSLFVSQGLTRVGIDYAWPTFEHGGNRLQPVLKPLFGMMRALEESPFRMFGTSVIVHFVKQ